MSPRERERELIESLKQSEIANVVTKGLNPNVPMKDSGIPWIGMIPEHWEVSNFGKCFTFSKGLPITKANLVDKGVAVISYGQIHDKSNTGTTIHKSLIRYVSTNWLNTNPQCIMNNGDFAFADTSEDIDGAGNCIYNDYSEKLFAGYHTIIARPKEKINSKYWAYLFQNIGWKSQIQSSVNGVKVYSISKTILKKAYLLIPPLSEQRAIVSYLDAKLSKIDRCLADLQSEIDYLKEFKQRLISDAVTGQICVAEPQKGEPQ